MEYLESIKPTCYKDVIGNKMQVKNLIEILKNPKHSPKVLALIGPIGCGKTLLCSLLFKELDLKVYDVSTKETLQIASSFLVNKTIECYSQAYKRKILFLDNVDILLNTEKNTMSLIDSCIPDLIRTNTFLLMTSKPSEEKTLTTALKKSLEVIKIGYPSIKDAFIYLTSVLKDEDEEALLAIVKKQRGSIRDIMLNLKQSTKELDEVVKDRGYKEYNNFEIIQSFFLSHSWNDVDAILNSDPSIISYLLYENVMDDVYNNREANSTMKTYTSINKYLVDASVMEKYMQDTLDWSISNTIQIVKVGGIYVSIKDLKKKVTRKDVKFRFSQVLSKLSHKNIMNKKICTMPLPIMDMINLIDSSAIKMTTDNKQISVTYDKYFP